VHVVEHLLRVITGQASCACELEFSYVLGSTDINLVVLAGAVDALCG
jgi:hypothetical protein